MHGPLMFVCLNYFETRGKCRERKNKAAIGEGTTGFFFLFLAAYIAPFHSPLNSSPHSHFGALLLQRITKNLKK